MAKKKNLKWENPDWAEKHLTVPPIEDAVREDYSYDERDAILVSDVTTTVAHLMGEDPETWAEKAESKAATEDDGTLYLKSTIVTDTIRQRRWNHN